MDNLKEFELLDEQEYKKKKFTIRMNITMDKEMTQEEAENVIFSALRNVGMKAHCGWIV